MATPCKQYIGTSTRGEITLLMTFFGVIEKSNLNFRSKANYKKLIKITMETIIIALKESI